MPRSFASHLITCATDQQASIGPYLLHHRCRVAISQCCFSDPRASTRQLQCYHLVPSSTRCPAIQAPNSRLQTPAAQPQPLVGPAAKPGPLSAPVAQPRPLLAPVLAQLGPPLAPATVTAQAAAAPSGATGMTHKPAAQDSFPKGFFTTGGPLAGLPLPKVPVPANEQEEAGQLEEELDVAVLVSMDCVAVASSSA